MFSIRSIFTAAVALATLASAIPLTPPGTGAVSNPADSLSQILPGGMLSSGGPANAALGSASPSALGSPLPAKRSNAAAQSPGDILNTCHAGVEPLVAQILVIIKVKDFDHVKVIDLVKQIIVFLNVAIAELKITVAAKLTAEVLLTIGGVVHVVADLAVIVYALLKLVVVLLFDLRLIVDVTLAGLLRTVGILLFEVLTLVVGLVVGLDVAIKILLEVVVIDNLKVLALTQILVLVGIKA